VKAKSIFTSSCTISRSPPVPPNRAQPHFYQWRDVLKHVLALFEGQGITDWLMEAQAQGSQLAWTVPSQMGRKSNEASSRLV